MFQVTVTTTEIFIGQSTVVKKPPVMPFDIEELIIFNSTRVDLVKEGALKQGKDQNLRST